MKRLLILIFALVVLASPAWGGGLLIGSSVSGSCGPTSEPNGSLFSDGFEGTGSGGYELVSGSDPKWYTAAGSPVTNYSLSGLGLSVYSCNYGLKTEATSATNFVYYKLPSPSSANVQNIDIEIYIESESIANGTNAPIYLAGTTNGGSNSYGVVRLAKNADQLQILGYGSSASTATNISTNTPYRITACITEYGTNNCGEGDGVSWIKVGNGSKYTFSSSTSTSDPPYYLFGITSVRTVSLIFGYVSIN
jgi:hypothetical protein